MKYTEVKNLCELFECSATDLREFFGKLRDMEPDFYAEIDGKEFRFISDNVIWNTYVESMEELVKDCYLGNTELPWWLEINWEQTARNVFLSDGYGNHFAAYDGEEEEVKIDGEVFHVFRTN